MTKLFLLTALFSSFFAFKTNAETAVYDSERGIILLTSKITSGEYSKFLNAAQEITKNGHKVRLVLVHNLLGGRTYEALQIGQWMLSNGIDVEIHGQCYSSCANYIFLAGKRKYLNSAIIGYHGSPTETEKRLTGADADPNYVSEEDFLNAQKNGSESREDIIKKRKYVRENEPLFFATTGVDQNIFSHTVNAEERKKLGCADDTRIYVLGFKEFIKYHISNVEGSVRAINDSVHCLAPSLRKDL